jgi:hypothetical protein
VLDGHLHGVGAVESILGARMLSIWLRCARSLRMVNGRNPHLSEEPHTGGGMGQAEELYREGVACLV